MGFKSFAVTILGLFVSLNGHSAERAFRIFTTKQITPAVERFYGRDGSAFATVFCSHEAVQAMMVDSRIPELDGKSFLFSSFEECEQARVQAREFSRKCAVDLVISLENKTAQVRIGGCSEN